MTTPGNILLVEDNEDDVFLMKRSLKAAGIINPVILVEDGEQAIDYLSGNHVYQDRTKYPLPCLVFLDLKLPMKMGMEVLSWIRSQPEFAKLLVVVLTSSNEPTDLREAYRLGVNTYLVKPATTTQLVDLAHAFSSGCLEFSPDSKAA